MNKKVLYCGALCLSLGFFACSEEDTESIPVSPFFEITNPSLISLQEGENDTLILSTHLDLDSLKLVCQIETEGEYSVPTSFSMESVQRAEKDKYYVILADAGTEWVYDQQAVLSCDDPQTGETFVTQPFNVRKKFFTGLPAVCIDTPEGQEVTSKEEWLKDSHLRIYNEEGALSYEGAMSIKGRGNTTWTAPKKPYALKLDEKSEILQMPKHKRWVLLANYLDRTLMRNHIAFYLAQSEGISLEWTPRGRFVEVVFNGKHRGSYYLCEQIKIDENRVNIHENEPEDIDGGYLLKWDVAYDEVNKFRTPVFDFPVMLKEPDEEDLTPAQFDFIQEYICQTEKVLTQDNFAESGLYKERIDIDTFIDYWIINEVTGNGESNWPKSVYMYKDMGGKLKAGPIWDYDYATFGKAYDDFHNLRSVWNRQLFQDPSFVQRAQERWALLRPEFEKALEEINRSADLIRLSAEANEKLWPIGHSDVNGDETLSFQEAVDKMRNGLAERLEWIDAHIGEL